MIEITLLDFILSWIVLLLAFLALRKYTIPPWISFLLNVGVVLYAFVLILVDGPRARPMEVIFLIVGAAMAARIWWRDLRDTRWGRPRGT